MSIDCDSGQERELDQAWSRGMAQLQASIRETCERQLAIPNEIRAYPRLLFVEVGDVVTELLTQPVRA